MVLQSRKKKKMEPMTLLSAAMTMLTPYLVKSGEKIAEEMGGSLWTWIKSKFNGKAELPANPSESDQQEIQKQLMMAVASDSQFAKELEEIMEKIRTSGQESSGQMNIINNATVQKQVNITNNSGSFNL